MSIHTKSILYKSLLRPIWAYGMQILSCAKPSQIRSTQAFQSISLRLIASARWYITNKALHKDLKITIPNFMRNYDTIQIHSSHSYRHTRYLTTLHTVSKDDGVEIS
uniref:Putative RNA-directed DNA polymerase n=1 Tax=Schizaphis graminum TaxID=13262 RepID=A0A2S2P9J7_SCHGA